MQHNDSSPTRKPSDRHIDLSVDIDLLEKTIRAAMRACHEDSVVSDIHTILRHAHNTVVECLEQARDYNGLCVIRGPEQLDIETA